MNISTLLLLIAVGLVTGAFGGMLGIGGGLIVVALKMFFSR